MASLQERNGSFRVQFSSHGKLHGIALGRVTRAEGEPNTTQVDTLSMRLRQGLLTLPAGCDLVAFVRHDGRAPV
jgi:hypothetical protein